jgi:predicted DNA-binding transcriptional regulator AlpA
MSEERLLNTQEVLNRLGISRKTLYNLMEKGKIRPIDKPAFLTKHPRLQFRESDVDKLLNGESAPTDEEAHPVIAA